MTTPKKCTHNKGWKFEKTGKGTKRTCNKCGVSITESTNMTTANLDELEKKKKRKAAVKEAIE